MHRLLKLLLTLVTALSINISAYALNDNTLKDNTLNPIRMLFIFHDEVPASKRSSIYVERIRLFVIEFKRITGRDISVA